MKPTIRLLPLVLAAAALTVPLSGSAVADPGVPKAPVAVFTEGFENGMGADPILLPSYLGPPPVNETYTANPLWLTACNGWLTSAQNPATEPPGAGCGAFWGAAKQFASDLATWSGADPTTNHALVNYTSAYAGVDNAQLETTTPIPLSGASRFLTFAVDAAARGCNGYHPLLKFYLLDGATAIPTFANPIDPCVNPGAVVNGTSVGTYVSDSPQLFAGSSVGIRLLNGQAQSYGNDSAVDNIRVIDVTPQLDKTFSAATAPVGTGVTMTFTITNTTELAVKNGWTFTDTLPAGLVAQPSTATSDCPGGVVTASASSVSATGNLATGQTSCTVSVQVSAAHAGTYTNCATNISGVAGLLLPGCSSVRFTLPEYLFDAHAHGGMVIAPLLGVPPIAPADLSCATAPATHTNGVLNAPLPTFGSLGVINNRASGTVDAQGRRTATASSTTADVRLLAGVVSADAVTSTATAQDDDTGHVTTSGATQVVNLRVAGVPVVNPVVNLTINVPLVGTVVVNEQTTFAGGYGVIVNALHIKLIGGTDIIVSHAQAALIPPGGLCPPRG
jgi:uncharacterized repeat protein (TIGR01451 family)